MTGRSPLYRNEVLEAKRNRWLGGLLLRQPISHWIMTWAAIALASAVAVFLAVGEYARTIRVTGQLSPSMRSHASAGGERAPALEAELRIPERLLASVDVGSEVLLRYPAYPHQQFGLHRGRIVDVGRAALPPRPGSATTSDFGRRSNSYPATVALEAQSVRDDRGREHALRAGLEVEADIVADRRRLYEWLFEPLARWRPRTATHASSAQPERTP